MKDYTQRSFHGRWMKENYEPGLVTVIIPTYNAVAFIGDTLYSVYNQSYRPIEVIVIDDGSTDSTRTVVEDWRRKYCQDTNLWLTYLLQENKGAPAARNHGLIEARGEFIQFIDSDDLLALSKISSQVQIISKCESKTAIYGKWRVFAGAQNKINIYDEHSAIDENNSLKGWIGLKHFLPLHSLLWRRDDVYNLGPWDETLSANQDGDYVMRFLLQDGRLVFCPSAWVYYRKYENSALSVSEKNNREVFESKYQVISKIQNELTIKGRLDEYREALSIHYAYLANRYALYHKNLTRHCIKRSKQLSLTGKIQDIISYPLVSNLLGLNFKKRIANFIRFIFKVKINNSFFLQHMPVTSVSSIEGVCIFDVH